MYLFKNYICCSFSLEFTNLKQIIIVTMTSNFQYGGLETTPHKKWNPKWCQIFCCFLDSGFKLLFPDSLPFFFFSLQFLHWNRSSIRNSFPFSMKPYTWFFTLEAGPSHHKPTGIRDKSFIFLAICDTSFISTSLVMVSLIPITFK